MKQSCRIACGLMLRSSLSDLLRADLALTAQPLNEAGTVLTERLGAEGASNS